MGIKAGSERKYRIIAEAQRKGHAVTFDVLYYAQSRRYSDIADEIGRMESSYIRRHNPILNTQVPRADNWHKFETKQLDVKSILNDILQGE